VFILILSCFWIILCIYSSTISLVGIGEVRCVQSLSRHQSIYGFQILYQSRAIKVTRYTRHPCTKRSHTISFKFLSLTIRAINDYLTPIDNRGRLARLYTFSFDEIIIMLFPRILFQEILFAYSSERLALWDHTWFIHIKIYCFSLKYNFYTVIKSIIFAQLRYVFHIV